MQWWDTSALLSLVLVERTSASVEALLAADDGLAVWWGTLVEGASGIWRAQRGGAIRASGGAASLASLEQLLSSASTIPPSEEVRATACHVLRRHDLTAADALQLAAALIWVEHQPKGAGFVCLDRRLCEAATREGFRVLPESG